jgi:hypothetical protein
MDNAGVFYDMRFLGKGMKSATGQYFNPCQLYFIHPLSYFSILTGAFLYPYYSIPV